MLEISVLKSVIPDEDPIIIDHNTSGISWLQRFYPTLAGRKGDGFFAGDSFFGRKFP